MIHKNSPRLQKMKHIFYSRTNNYIQDVVKKNILDQWWDLFDFLENEKLERIWRNLYQWKLPKNITISWTDEYFLL